MLKRNIFVSTLVVALILMPTTVIWAAEFPIEEDFSGVEPADWTLVSNALWDTTVSGDQTLRLTSTAADQNGLGFYDVSFASDLGIVAEFTYYAGDGTGADGLAFFLVDGDLVNSGNITPGAFGGALGYAQNETEDGIPNAYLGIGFDEFGNFASNNEGKSGGTGSSVPDNVTLRGSGNGMTGYDYLTHTDVFGSFGERIDGGWRTARISVQPGVTDATVRVEMSWDGGATWETVIDDYTYSEAPPDNLKLGFTGSTGGSTNVHAIGDLSVTIPIDLTTTLLSGGGETVERGDTVAYSYSVSNDGANDSSTTTISNNMPLGETGFTNVDWSYVATHGLTGSGDDSDVSSLDVGIPAGETVTVSVTSTVGSLVVDTTDLDVTVTAVPEADKNDTNPGSETVVFTYTPDAPTQAESDALILIGNYAASAGTTTSPTVSDYTDAGVTGVTASTLEATNAFVADSGDSSFDSADDIQVFASRATAIEKIGNYAASDGTTTAPTLDDYTDAEVSGVTADNLTAINTFVSESEESEVTTADNIQSVVSTAVAIEKVKDYADSSGTTTTPTLEDYQQMGATEVTAENLDAINEAVAEKSSGEVGSLSQIQSVTQTAATEYTNSIRSSSGSTATRVRQKQPTNDENSAELSINNDLRERLSELRELYQKLQDRLLAKSLGVEVVGIEIETVKRDIDLPVRDLTMTNEGDDVKQLQEILIRENAGPSAVELSRVGATGYFGTYTQNALGEYQQINSISPHSGYFGPITRAQMKSADLSGLWW